MEHRRYSDGRIQSSVAESPVLLGKYEIGKLLGCGTFAKVYHGRVIATGQSVAIKVINKARIVGSTLASNVKREISVMRCLDHSRIVKLFEVLATKTKIFFVMEFVKGGELFGKIAKGRLSEDLSRRFFQQLISAVGHCHIRGVFHRDLKPENLLVDEYGDLKVSDFGLSAVTGQNSNDGLLHTLCGTPAYVAPEILAKKGYDGAKADVWSAGVVLFVLVAGHLPFNDPNLMEMYKKIYRGEFKFPKWVAPELRRFLRRILDTNPATRITVHEIFHDPWFRKGYKEMRCQGEQRLEGKEIFGIAKKLNAFDIITFSSGLDLSGLFKESGGSSWEEERFVLAESPEKIMEKMSDLCGKENLNIKWNKATGLEMEEENGIWSIGLEIFQLTDSLVVLEVNKRGGDGSASALSWRNKLKPELIALVHTHVGGRPGPADSVHACFM